MSGSMAGRPGRACNCIGPQNGQPRCPCMMGGFFGDGDGRVEPKRMPGDVIPTYHWPASIQPRGCVCPAGSEKTCLGSHCPRKPLQPLVAS